MVFRGLFSVTILTKNSALTLEKTLASLTSFPEVIVYDTGSTDQTLEIAKKFPNVKISVGSFTGFGPTHNAASRLATHDWIVSIDSDEILSPALAEEILSLTPDISCVYGIFRRNYFNDRQIKWCGGWHPDPVIRIYHRQKTAFNDAAVHEKIKTDGLNIVYLKNSLEHVPYREISDFLHKMQTYSTLFAKQHQGKKKSSLFTAIWHGFFAFLKSYIFKRGILGGKEGLIISLYNGHATFYKYLKLDEANRKAQ
jgi:glycosyltransferase involved in cell wall biosynthesis